MHSARLQNIFGAVAVAAFDAIQRGSATTIARGGATAAALNLVGHVPGLSIELLARGLGLSHPGTVRLIDGLARAELVTRASSAVDRRSVEVRLTPAGRRKRRTLLGNRRSALDEFLAPLDATERAQLDAIASKLLRAAVKDVPVALATCRLCDEGACIECPVTSALEPLG